MFYFLHTNILGTHISNSILHMNTMHSKKSSMVGGFKKSKTKNIVKCDHCDYSGPRGKEIFIIIIYFTVYFKNIVLKNLYSKKGQIEDLLLCMYKYGR